MPTSDSEAQQITKIISEYLGPRVAAELTERLHKEVGKNTDNESLRISLEMLFTLCRQFPWKDTYPTGGMGKEVQWGDDH